MLFWLTLFWASSISLRSLSRASFSIAFAKDRIWNIIGCLKTNMSYIQLPPKKMTNNIHQRTKKITIFTSLSLFSSGVSLPGSGSYTCGAKDTIYLYISKRNNCSGFVGSYYIYPRCMYHTMYPRIVKFFMAARAEIVSFMLVDSLRSQLIVATVNLP